MMWFRTNKGVVAWLALFALACQLALTFGHVHLSKFGTGSVAQPAVQTNGAATAVNAPPSRSKDPAGPAGDFCAICANISLAATLILPILAIILAPGLPTHIPQWSLAASEPAAFDHLPFSARGPPHA